MTSSRRRLVRVAALTMGAVAASSGAMAATASATATITADKACYVNLNPAVGATMNVTGTGFTPGDSVELEAGSSPIDDATATPTGTVTFNTAAPLLSTAGPGSKKTTLTAIDQPATGAPIMATAVVQSANLTISVKPLSVHNVHKDKVTFRFSGFTTGKRIYGYYGYKKKIVAKAKFNKATGPCGLLTQKALLYPGGHPAHDSYQVTFESTSKYSKTAIPRVTGSLSVFHF